MTAQDGIDDDKPVGEGFVADPYPEHTKQQAFAEASQAIGEFLDESGYVLAEYVEVEGFSEPKLLPASTSTEKIIADFFGIDLTKIETERRAMVASLTEKTNS